MDPDWKDNFQNVQMYIADKVSMVQYDNEISQGYFIFSKALPHGSCVYFFSLSGSARRK